MKAFVTGANGFIGLHVVERLVKLGDDVTCLVSPGTDLTALESMGVALRIGDVHDPTRFADLCRSVDVVYHLEGSDQAGDQSALRRVNAGGVARVADACASAETPPVLLVLSSLAAAGPSDAEIPRVEGDPPQPVSAYGRSKLEGEEAARRRAGRVPITVVRPPMVFGEHDRETLELFRLADRGWSMAPSLRAQRLSLVYAGDLAQLVVTAAERGERLPASAGEGQPGEGIYYAGDDQRPTFADLGQLLGEAVGRGPVRVVSTPYPLTFGIAAVAEAYARFKGRPAALTIDKAREATAGSWMCSSRKAREQLGLKFRIPLAQRLTETAEWYRGEGWL